MVAIIEGHSALARSTFQGLNALLNDDIANIRVKSNLEQMNGHLSKDMTAVRLADCKDRPALIKEAADLAAVFCEVIARLV